MLTHSSASIVNVRENTPHILSEVLWVVQSKRFLFYWLSLLWPVNMREATMSKNRKPKEISACWSIPEIFRTRQLTSYEEAKWVLKPSADMPSISLMLHLSHLNMFSLLKKKQQSSPSGGWIERILHFILTVYFIYKNSEWLGSVILIFLVNTVSYHCPLDFYCFP